MIIPDHFLGIQLPLRDRLILDSDWESKVLDMTQVQNNGSDVISYSCFTLRDEIDFLCPCHVTKIEESWYVVSYNNKSFNRQVPFQNVSSQNICKLSTEHCLGLNLYYI